MLFKPRMIRRKHTQWRGRILRRNIHSPGTRSVVCSARNSSALGFVAKLPHNRIGDILRTMTMPEFHHSRARALLANARQIVSPEEVQAAVRHVADVLN